MVLTFLFWATPKLIIIWSVFLSLFFSFIKENNLSIFLSTYSVFTSNIWLYKIVVYLVLIWSLFSKIYFEIISAGFSFKPLKTLYPVRYIFISLNLLYSICKFWFYIKLFIKNIINKNNIKYFKF